MQVSNVLPFLHVVYCSLHDLCHFNTARPEIKKTRIRTLVYLESGRFSVELLATVGTVGGKTLN